MNSRAFLYIIASAANVVVFAAICCGQSVGTGQKNRESRFDEIFPTPLQQAIALNYPWIVERLISQGVSPNAPDRSDVRNAPILLATAYDREEIVKLLIKYGARVNMSDENGVTALMYACLRTNIVITTILIDAGADVNAKSDSGATAIMIAAEKGDFRTFQLLLTRKANVRVKTQTGATALMVAADDSRIVKALIDNGSDLNEVDREGWSSLFHSIRDGYINKAKALLELGAKICILDKVGDSPFEIVEKYAPKSAKENLSQLLNQHLVTASERCSKPKLQLK